MEMKPDDLKKYNERFPLGTPRQGRFAPHGQFFLCETDDQVAKLEAAGWNTNPLLHVPPYPSEEAVHVPKWRDVKLTVEPPAPKVDEAAAIRAELEAARARIAELEGKTEDAPRRRKAA